MSEEYKANTLVFCWRKLGFSSDIIETFLTKYFEQKIDEIYKSFFDYLVKENLFLITQDYLKPKMFIGVPINLQWNFLYNDEQSIDYAMYQFNLNTITRVEDSAQEIDFETNPSIRDNIVEMMNLAKAFLPKFSEPYYEKLLRGNHDLNSALAHPRMKNPRWETVDWTPFIEKIKNTAEYLSIFSNDDDRLEMAANQVMFNLESFD